MPSNQVTHIFFDLGETLVDLRGLVAAMAGEIAACYPTLATEAAGIALYWVRHTAKDTLEAQGARYRPGLEIAAAALVEAFAQRRTEVQLSVAGKHVQTAWRGYLRQARLCPDVTLDFLKKLRSLVRGLGIITDSDTTMVKPLMDRLGLAGLFGVVLVSDTVGAYKPDPKIYRAALDLAGAAPGTSAFVSNSPTDLRGAAEVGMKPVLVRRDRPAPALDRSMRAIEIDNFLELPDALDLGSSA